MRILSDLVVLFGLCLTACGGSSVGNAPPAPPSTGPTTTAIAAIQGPGDISPVEGQIVAIDGVVSGDFQENDVDVGSNLGGFFVQNEIGDGNDDTSDGIFVFDGNSPTVNVNVGDRVTVSGTVQEFFGETQIAASGIAVTGTGMIQPSTINLPASDVTTNSDDEFIADLESFEGMLVRFPQALSISELFNVERYGAMRLSHGGRLYQFTNQNMPDPIAYMAHRRANAARSIILDDGQRINQATPIRYLNAGEVPNAAIRIGDIVTGLVGNFRYSRGSGGSGDQSWRLMPVSAPSFVAANPRPGAPAVSGSFRIASFNVLNYFSTIDNGQNKCGPAGNDGCRGADSNAERDRQLTKIVTALAMIDADVVGLIELENNARDSLVDIVDALNNIVGAGTYAPLNTGTIGDDAIKTGFIHKLATASPQGAFALLDAGVDPQFNDKRNRPALAQTFTATTNGASITVILNHLKSKGSDCESDGDPNTSDGQGNCKQTRTAAAAAIADWLATDPTGSGDSDFLIIGDLNAYLEEDPLSALKSAGYVNLVEATSGADAYSFVFDGQSGALDHALASPSLVPQVAKTIEWHINADEAPVRDYNLESSRDPAIFDGETPYRASDHDPVIVGIDLN